jgi:hypothetical protein
VQLKVSEMQASGDNSDQWTTEILWVCFGIRKQDSLFNIVFN